MSRLQIRYRVARIARILMQMLTMPKLLVVWAIFLCTLIALDRCCKEREAKANPVRMVLIETVEERYDRIVIESASECGVNPFLAREYLNIEELAGVPLQYRGMLAAKACTETRGCGGGWKCDMQGDAGAALGTLQLHNHWNVDRTNPIASAYAYLAAIWKSHDYWIPRKCRKVPQSKRYEVAQMRVNRGPKWRLVNAGEQRCGGLLPASHRKLDTWRLEMTWLDHPSVKRATR